MSRAITRITSLRSLLALSGALLLAAPGCGGGDPCGSESGACLTIEMTGPITGIESMQIDLSGVVTFRTTKAMPAGTSTLPVQIGVLLPEVTGEVTVNVAALAGGKTIGAGTTAASVSAGQRVKVSVAVGEVAAPTCSDGKANGGESDVDCGGAGSCGRCPDGKACKAGGDCASGVCSDGAMPICVAASCSDKMKNGSESDLDCGGACGRCGAGKACGKAADCLSGRCDAGKCSGLTMSFAAPLTYPLPAVSSNVVAGDLNGDGLADLVSATTAGSVSVLLARGPHSYAPAAIFAAGAPGILGPRFTALGDINRDGKLDVVVVAGLTGMQQPVLSFLSGSGDGKLAAAVNTNLAASSQPTGLVLADVNGDGALDVAVAELLANQVQVLLNDAGGGGGTVNFAMPGASAIASADFNDDGRADLAIDSNSGGHHVSLLVQDANSRLVPGPTVALTGTGTSLHIADVDADGKIDLLVGQLAPGGVAVVPGRPRTMNLFGVPTLIASSSGVEGIASGDFNGDSRIDLLLDPGSTSGALLLFGEGAGAFGMPSTLTFPAQPVGVLAADLDGDKKSELIATLVGQVVLFPNDGAGNYAVSKPFTVAAAGTPRGAALADVNGDGKPDLLVAAAKGVIVNLGVGDGTFLPFSVEPVGMSLVSVLARDLDGDGKVDLAATGTAGNVVNLALGKGDGTFGMPVVLAVGTGPQMVASGDLDGDGRADLVTANATSSDVSVLMGGVAGFAPATAIGIGGAAAAVTIADVTGDGKADILCAKIVNDTLVVLPGNGNGTFLAPTSFGVGNRPIAVATADVNGDGRLDAITANTASASVSVLISAGGGTFQAAVTYGVGPAASTISVADFNLDGRPDLVVGSSSFGSISVLASSGDASGSFAQALGYLTGTFPAVVAGDLNGDGKPEIVTSNGSAASLNVIFNTSH